MAQYVMSMLRVSKSFRCAAMVSGYCVGNLSESAEKYFAP